MTRRAGTLSTEDNGRERKDGNAASVPERALALAVILQALHDLSTINTGCTPTGLNGTDPRVVQDDARAFFFDKAGAWTQSLDWWCLAADLEPDCVKRRARAILDGEATVNVWGVRLSPTREDREPTAPAPVPTARPSLLGVPMQPDTAKAVAILREARAPITHRELAAKVGVHHAALNSILSAAVGRGVPIVKRVLEGRPFYAYRETAAAPTA